MLRSMNSAISGMQSFQTMLDVIGNNIANVNTVGFKAGRTDFADILSQTMSGGSTPTTTTPPGFGGTNPQQVGLGVKVGAIQTMFTQGADQTTGNSSDLAIQGSGLFAVSNNGGATDLYSRAGNFSLDSNNNLVLPNGYIAMGFDSAKTAPLAGAPATAQTSLTVMNLNAMLKDYAGPGATSPSPGSYTNSAGTTTYSLASAPNLQIGPDGSVTVDVQATTAGTTTSSQVQLGTLAIATVPNAGGLEKSGDSLYSVSNNSGSPTFQKAGDNGSGQLMVGALEMSNVDLTNEMANMLVAENGYAANAHVIGADNTILNALMNMKNS